MPNTAGKLEGSLHPRARQEGASRSCAGKKLHCRTPTPQQKPFQSPSAGACVSTTPPCSLRVHALKKKSLDSLKNCHRGPLCSRPVVVEKLRPPSGKGHPLGVKQPHKSDQDVSMQGTHSRTRKHAQPTEATENG